MPQTNSKVSFIICQPQTLKASTVTQIQPGSTGTALPTVTPPLADRGGIRCGIGWTGGFGWNGPYMGSIWYRLGGAYTRPLYGLT